MQEPEPKQVEFGPPVHLSFQCFEPIDLAFRLTIQTNRQLYPINPMKLMNSR